MNLTEQKQSTQTEIAKSQEMRFLDVTLFGPLMVMSALNKEPPPLMRLIMLGIGVGTIIYNANNYFQTMEQKKGNLK